MQSPLLLFAASVLAAPESFSVVLDTDVVVNGARMKPIVIAVNRSWAPEGADHLYEVVKDGFYNEAAFFRYVPQFVVQFGIAGTPAENQKWTTPIKDDPVVASNLARTVTYASAGPGTRTTQLFINFIDNPGLDSQGFAPVGTVVQGFDTAEAIFNPTPNDTLGVDQEKYLTLGNAWINATYPGINFITKGSVSELAAPEKLSLQI